MTTTQKILVSETNGSEIAEVLNRTLVPVGIRAEYDDTAPALWSFWDDKTDEIIGASDSLSEAVSESLGTWRLYCASAKGRKARRLSAGCSDLVRISEVVS